MKRRRIGLAAGLAASGIAAGAAFAPAALAEVPDLPANCVGALVSRSNGTDVDILDNSTKTSTITVTGATGTVRDVDVITQLVHTNNGDLEISLTHAGKTVRMLSAKAAGRAGKQGFAGTRWDDSAATTVTDADLQSDGPHAALVPEVAMATFAGTDPNGEWKLTVKDTAAGDVGTLDEWSLDIGTAAAATPLAGVQNFTNNTPQTVGPDPGTGTVTSEINVSGAPTYLADLDVATIISHAADPGELKVTLTSPQGTTVVLSKRRGSGSLSALTTTWNDSAPLDITQSDDLWGTNPGQLQTRAQVGPEGSLAGLIGENPNGKWTLTITDAVAGDGFSLSGWTLKVNGSNGCAAPPDGGGTVTPPGGGGTVTPPGGAGAGTPQPPVCEPVRLVTKVTGRTRVARGRTAILKLQIRNAATGAAAGTTARFTIPAGFTLVGRPRLATVTGRTVTLNVGGIAGGKARVITLRFKATARAAFGRKKTTVRLTTDCGSSGTGAIAVSIAKKR